jgi:hypothetical protein
MTLDRRKNTYNIFFTNEVKFLCTKTIIPVEAVPTVYMSTIFLGIIWFIWTPACEGQR